MPDIDEMIEKLVSVKNSRPGTEVNLPEDDIIWLCRTSRQVSFFKSALHFVNLWNMAK